MTFRSFPKISASESQTATAGVTIVRVGDIIIILISSDNKTLTSVSTFSSQIVKCSELTSSKRPLSAFCVVKCGGQEMSSSTVTQKDGKDHAFLVSVLSYQCNLIAQMTGTFSGRMYNLAMLIWAKSYLV